MTPKPMANATRWSTEDGSSGASTGSMSAATAGSPIQPRPSDAIVMPSCVTAR